MADVTITAPVLVLALTCDDEHILSYTVEQIVVTPTNVANKTAQVLTTLFTSDTFVGQNVLISAMPSPYTGFDGTWKVLSVGTTGTLTVLTINYNYGTALGYASIGPSAVLNPIPVPLKVLITTGPYAPILKLSFGTNLSATAWPGEPEVEGVGLKFGVGTPFVRTTATFADDSQTRRWASVAYNRQIFFTNELNPIAFTDGTGIFRYSNTQPSARYIDLFFDHLVLGWPSWNGCPSPTRVQWSDLYRLNIWHPSPKNEADSYDVEEWCRTDFPLCGCTGLGRIGNTMWVYTPTAIVSMRYQGRMKSPVFGQSLTGSTAGGGGPIMILGDKVLKDIGNSLQYGLIVYKDMHYFWDGVEQDFYRFNGEQVESIGIRIKQYFLSNVNQSWPLFQATWGYARPGRQEIVWVFVSNKQASMLYDQAIVYNWKTGKWYTQSVENFYCFCGPTIPGGRADDLISTADQLTGPSNQLLVASTLNPPVWGANGLLRESISSDADSALIAQDPPLLVTKDFGYDDLEHIKEASSIVLHATDKYKNGVSVSLSVRDSLDDPVTYPTTDLYKYDPEEKRLGLPRNAGRLLRYKFQPATTNGPVREFTWGGFAENVKRKSADA